MGYGFSKNLTFKVINWRMWLLQYRASKQPPPLPTIQKNLFYDAVSSESKPSTIVANRRGHVCKVNNVSISTVANLANSHCGKHQLDD